MEKDKIIDILNSDFRNMFLVSIISADSNITEKDIQGNLALLKQCKELTEETQCAKRINKLDEVKDFIEQGFIILRRDLSDMKK